MTAQNDIVSTDRAVLNWDIICAHPIVPDDWDLIYPSEIRPGTTFEIQLKIKPNKDLPTMPKVSVYKIKGKPLVGENLEIDMTSPFDIYSKDETPNADCNFGDCVPELALTTGGKPVGMSPDLKSHATNGNTYTVVVSKLDGGMNNKEGIYGFAVFLSNGFSSIKYDITAKAIAMDTITLLDPAPKGTGEYAEVQVAKWDANWVGC